VLIRVVEETKAKHSQMNIKTWQMSFGSLLLWFVVIFNFKASFMYAYTIVLHWLGRYLAEMTKKVISDLEESKYQVIGTLHFFPLKYLQYNT
jgi:hypothetical protein